MSIKEKLKQLLSELGPYLVTAFACVNAAFVGIVLFGNEGASGLIRFFQFVCFVFAPRMCALLPRSDRRPLLHPRLLTVDHPDGLHPEGAT